jgi:hypothetical protein
MTTMRVIVQAAGGAAQDDVDPWTALAVIASLSAEPETLPELTQALCRYQPEHHLFATAPTAAADEPAGPWCLIDLPGRTLVAGGGFVAPQPGEALEAEQSQPVVGFPILWFNVASDWLFTTADADWRALVKARAAARSAVAPFDPRPVLYGAPLLSHLAAGVLDAAGKGALDEERVLDETRAIHVRWLTTPRADLGGQTPRQVLLAERDRLAAEIEQRSHQWSLQAQPVPALPVDARAYRYGGFGTAEVVLYFDLVRVLLGHAWDAVLAGARPALAALVEQLAGVREQWLHQPNEESGPDMAPAHLIELERRRVPLTGEVQHLDCNCAICQAQAEGDFGPMFRVFDGFHLDMEDEFAFSLCRTREEWQEQQQTYREMAERMERGEFQEITFDDEGLEELEADGAEATEGAEAPVEAVWESSYVDWGTAADPDLGPQQGLLALSFPLAELTSKLRARPDGTDRAGELNDIYRRLRSSGDTEALAAAADEFRAALEEVCRRQVDLTAKCADLQGRLDEVLRNLG